MNLGEYLRECRQGTKKGVYKIAAELYATGKFGLYRNEIAFGRTISNLEMGNGGKDVRKRNLKLFNGRLDLWVKAYEADKSTLEKLIEKKVEQETDVTPDESKARTCRGHNLFLVFTVLKEFSDVSERTLERIINFVEKLDVVPTKEIIQAYVSQIIKK